jgi:hypothetical protein
VTFLARNVRTSLANARNVSQAAARSPGSSAASASASLSRYTGTSIGLIGSASGVVVAFAAVAAPLADRVRS